MVEIKAVKDDSGHVTLDVLLQGYSVDIGAEAAAIIRQLPAHIKKTDDITFQVFANAVITDDQWGQEPTYITDHGLNTERN